MKRCLILILLVATTGCKAPEVPAPVRPVRVYKVVPPEQRRIRTFSGTAKASEESALSFKVSGTITGILVDVGDHVQMGEVLATIDPLDYQLELEQSDAELASAEANARNAEANYERARSLYETRVASRTDLDSARAEAESNRANVIAAEKQVALAQRQLDYTRLEALSDGSIAEKIAEVNENVTLGQIILKMVAGTMPEVEIQMPENLIGQITVGQPIIAKFQALGGQEMQGKVLRVGVATTGTSTTFPVTLLIEDAKQKVRSGMTGEIIFKLDYAPGAEMVTVPAVAVGQDLEGRFVYLVTDYEGRYGVIERQPVTVGKILDQDIEIVSGLSGDERVVTAGIDYLKPGMKVMLYKGKPYGENE